MPDSKRELEGQSKKQKLSSFLADLRALDAEKNTLRSTAHTSAVSVPAETSIKDAK